MSLSASNAVCMSGIAEECEKRCQKRAAHAVNAAVYKNIKFNGMAKIDISYAVAAQDGGGSRVAVVTEDSPQCVFSYLGYCVSSVVCQAVCVGIAGVLKLALDHRQVELSTSCRGEVAAASSEASELLTDILPDVGDVVIECQPVVNGKAEVLNAAGWLDEGVPALDANSGWYCLLRSVDQ